MVVTDLLDENINIDEDVREVLEAIEAPEKFVYDDDPDEFFGNFADDEEREHYDDDEAHCATKEVGNQFSILPVLESLKYNKSVEVRLTRESSLDEFIMRKNISSLKQKPKERRKVYSLEEVDDILNDINGSC